MSPPAEPQAASFRQRYSAYYASSYSKLRDQSLVITAIAPASFLIAGVATLLVFYAAEVSSWAAWVLGPVLLLWNAEVLMSVISIGIAGGFCRCMPLAGRHTDLEPVGDHDLRRAREAEEREARRAARSGHCPTPKDVGPALRSVGRWRPPQVVRWDILGCLGSRMFGHAASLPLPVFLRPMVYRAYARFTRAKLHEVEHPLSSFPSLRSFFTRTLRPGLRPVNPLTRLTSPVDGRVVICGVVDGDRVEQVKGVTYSMAQFLGEHSSDCQGPNTRPRRSFEVSEEAVEARSGGSRRLFHLVLYLDPGDYHRLHAPCDMSIERLRHFPGTLFPISPVLTRLMPNLFALNERVCLCGEWYHGAFSYTAVGAYNVGSIDFDFDHSITTNRIRRDIRNPNLSVSSTMEMLSYGGVGRYAYVRRYDEPPLEPVQLRKGQQIGMFNLGSTVVLIFEAPRDFEFAVGPGDKVRLGQSLGDC